MGITSAKSSSEWGHSQAREIFATDEATGLPYTNIAAKIKRASIRPSATERPLKLDQVYCPPRGMQRAG
jgi:hypothetical protein